jgi:hypothetical protein
VKRAHQRTLEAIFAHPTSANIPWKDIEALFSGHRAAVSVKKWLEQHGE